MFDPSHQLFDYYHQKGHSELESYRLAARTLGRCMVHLANKPEQVPVSDLDTNTMPDTNEQPDSEIIDLGFDVTEADVARPVLKAATLDAEISFARTEPSRQKGLKQMLVGFRLTQPAETIDGKSVNAGFTLIKRVLMEPSGKWTKAMGDDALKRIHFAAAGPGKVTTGAWIGKPVRIRVTFRDVHTDDAGQEFPASNEIGAVYPMPKHAAA